MVRLNKRAQSTLEYVIILSVIVIAFLAARSLMNTAVTQSVTDSTNSMQRATARLP